MSLPKALAILTLVLFSAIGVAALFKNHEESTTVTTQNLAPVEIELDRVIQTVVPAAAVSSPVQAEKQPVTSTPQPPEADRIAELFNKTEPKLPFVETVVYKSRVDWQKGRPAWLSDYAGHYSTSRHFIARSLNGAPDYFKQEVAEGDKFNVYRLDKKLQFHLVVDTSRCKLWLYALVDNASPLLLKSYNVGLGRVDSSKASGLLTPLGSYTLGDRIAIYKPKAMGTHQGNKVEMIKVFGTRWIPFDKEVEGCTAPAKGFGIHGTPWSVGPEGSRDQTESVGRYESDGCIRLATPDIEELFAIIITKPTTIEIVRDFYASRLHDRF